MTLKHKRTPDEELWDSFHQLLITQIKEGKPHDVIETVIREATELHDEQIKFTEVNRLYYPIITWLSHQFTLFDFIGFQSYQEVLDLINKSKTPYNKPPKKGPTTMLQKYRFDYLEYEAGAGFLVDLMIFKPKDAKALLEFFDWQYDEEADPIDEILKKYAMKAIKIATAHGYNIAEVKEWFAEQEGMLKVDGSHGVELDFLSPYEFMEDYIHMTKKHIKDKPNEQL